MVAETNFKFVTCGTNILHIAFLDTFRFTTKNLRNKKRPARTNASKAISFLSIIAMSLVRN